MTTTLCESDRRVLAAVAAGTKSTNAIAEACGMARRTVYSALRRLQDAGVLVSRPYLRDTRVVVWDFRGVRGG